MSNDLLYGNEARNKIATGIKKLSDAVRVTLGPKGSNVLIEQPFGAPLIINDGVTIAKNIILKDKYENLGAQLIIEAATKTNDVAGDGTTTAIVLASSLTLNGLEAINKGINGCDLREGFDYYKDIIDGLIKNQSKEISSLEDVAMIATLSSNDAKIGKLIADAYSEVGLTGEVSVEESRGSLTHLDIVKGYSYDRGYASSYMINNEAKQQAELIKPDILVTDKKITSMKEIISYLENAMKSGKPLLIICDDIEQEVLSAIVMNKMRGVFNVVVTKAPSFGDRKIQLLKDIACISGATFISDSKGDSFGDDLTILGGCEKAIISQNQSVIMDGFGKDEDIFAYAEGLKTKLANETSLYEVDKLKERIARLLGGVAVIKVGAKTEVELHERKLRIEDALCAAKSAMMSGVIPGGGMTLFKISEKLEEYIEYPEALAIIKKALKEPFEQIVKNAGDDIQKVKSQIDSCKDELVWYDAKQRKVVSFANTSIIDPTSVEEEAILNALSIAGIVITTECAITTNEHEKINEENLL